MLRRADAFKFLCVREEPQILEPGSVRVRARFRDPLCVGRHAIVLVIGRAPIAGRLTLIEIGQHSVPHECHQPMDKLRRLVKRIHQFLKPQEFSSSFGQVRPAPEKIDGTLIDMYRQDVRQQFPHGLDVGVLASMTSCGAALSCSNCSIVFTTGMDRQPRLFQSCTTFILIPQTSNGGGRIFARMAYQGSKTLSSGIVAPHSRLLSHRSKSEKGGCVAASLGSAGSISPSMQEAKCQLQMTRGRVFTRLLCSRQSSRDRRFLSDSHTST
jgi:hypothetical protein